MIAPAGNAADVIVVGAGPAGSVTALALARSGRDVVLLDRAAFPRAKPCGDCLSPEAARVLDRLGILGRVDALAPARLPGWRIWSPDGHPFEGGFEHAARGDARVRTSMAVARDRLDDTLLRAALDAGVTLRQHTRVERLLFRDDRVVGVAARAHEGATDGLRARLVVGADGLRSVVARRAGATARPGPLRKLSFTMHPVLPRDFTAGLGEMHVVADGCVGLAPVGAGDPTPHNLTCVANAAARGAEARQDPRALVESMLRAAPGLADRLPALLAALESCPAPLASGPFDRPARFVVRDGLALVGDAAGYYDPFTGQGVFQALAGGERLAQTADRALRRGAGTVLARDLRSYARWVARSGTGTRTVQRAVEFVTARPALMNRFARALEMAPSFADALVATTGDIAPARSLAGRPLAALALALVQRENSR